MFALIIVLLILAVFVLPVFNKARMRNYSMDCQANMKKIIEASLLYAKDSKGWMPMAKFGPDNPKWWCEELMMLNYLPADKELLHCPADMNYSVSGDGAVTHLYRGKHRAEIIDVSYGWNQHLGNYPFSNPANGNFPPVKLASLPPDTVAGVCDGGETLMISNWRQMITSHSSGFLHPEVSTNLGFVDNHVENVTRKNLKQSMLTPAKD